MSLFLRFLYAFLIGGAFSLVAQVLIDKTSITPARILVLYVSVGVFLGAVGLYPPLVELAGCGATVPLVGFGANVAKGVRTAVDEQGALGILTGSFTAASAGCTAALLFGYIATLLSSGKPKRAE